MNMYYKQYYENNSNHLFLTSYFPMYVGFSLLKVYISEHHL